MQFVLCKNSQVGQQEGFTSVNLVPSVLLCCSVAAQVLRLTVEATGMARRLCAPREVIVERLFKR